MSLFSTERLMLSIFLATFLMMNDHIGFYSGKLKT